MDQVSRVHSIRFSKLDVRREKPSPVQVDGELMPATDDISVRVLEKALTVLVPIDTDV